MTEDDVLVQFDEVSYTYRGDWLQRVQALRAVSFAVHRGGAYGFLGANGAGKSTSIKLIMGLLLGHRGAIRLFGQAIGPPGLRASLGYLPEQPFFYENLRVREYLAYLGRLSRLSRAQVRDAHERVYELLDLGDLRRRRLGSFSKGMRQRFGLAQAIFSGPELLILDEPFSGLDPLWRARFKEILIDERRRGATLFFSSHILADVEDVCDHYIMIDHGRVLEHGALGTLFGQAPLQLIGTGQAPAEAELLDDGQWRWIFPEDERERVVQTVNETGGSIVRLERQRQALEDYFVARIRESHKAGGHLGDEPTAMEVGHAD
jgi:ABC-2 type transport system ATP-binding protein